jgi:hypothetical protein
VTRMPFCPRLTAHGLLSAAFCLRAFRGIEVSYFGDGGKLDLDDLAICTLDLNARRGQCLSSFHAPNDTPDALSVGGYDFDVVFAVQGLKGRKGLGYFHDYQCSFQSFFKGALPLSIDSAPIYA